MSTPTKLFVVAGVILGLAVGVSAQSVPTANPVVKVVRVPVRPIGTCDGRANFEAYCASCHGADAQGLGPAARGLETPPADLTLILVRHGGSFPSAHVRESIRGNHADAALREMPEWDRVLRSVSRSDQELDIRLINLVHYLESVQQR